MRGQLGPPRSVEGCVQRVRPPRPQSGLMRRKSAVLSKMRGLVASGQLMKSAEQADEAKPVHLPAPQQPQQQLQQKLLEQQQQQQEQPSVLTPALQGLVPRPANSAHLHALQPRRPLPDACVSDMRPAQPRHAEPHMRVSTSAVAHPARPWACRRRQQRPVVRRAVLPQQEQEQEQQPQGAHAAAATGPSVHCPDGPLAPPLLQQGAFETWICIRQTHPDGPAEVYEHRSPMSDATWANLQQEQRPSKLMTVHQRRCVAN